MQLEDTALEATAVPESGNAVRWQSVALPAEHGGWSLTAEPALLGLVVAFSWPGLALGIAAMVAFVARTPLKLVLVDRWRHRWLPRTTLAAKVAAGELIVFFALVAYAARAGEGRFWLPLLIAAPMVALELWFDMRSRGRRLLPELAGSVGIGAVATAIALTGGLDATLAWGLWIITAARSSAAIPYVRTQILRFRAKPTTSRLSDGAQAIGVLAVGLAWYAELVPLGAALAVTGLALINVVAVRLPPRPAVAIGVQQTIFGVVVIVATAVAVITS